MQSNKKLILMLCVCLSCLLCVACSGKKSNQMYSSGQSASVDSNAAVSLPQREVNKDNEVVAGDIGEPMQTQKQTALTQSGAVTDPYVTNATCSESNSDSSSFTRSTTIVSAVTDQDGFYTGKR